MPDLAGLHDPKEGVQKSRNQGCCPKRHCFRDPVHGCHDEHIGTRGFLQGQSTEGECCCPTTCSGGPVNSPIGVFRLWVPGFKKKPKKDCIGTSKGAAVWVWNLGYHLKRWSQKMMLMKVFTYKTGQSVGIRQFNSKIMASNTLISLFDIIIQYLPGIQSSLLRLELLTCYLYIFFSPVLDKDRKY